MRTHCGVAQYGVAPIARPFRKRLPSLKGGTFPHLRFIATSAPAPPDGLWLSLMQNGFASVMEWQPRNAPLALK